MQRVTISIHQLLQYVNVIMGIELKYSRVILIAGDTSVIQNSVMPIDDGPDRTNDESEENCDFTRQCERRHMGITKIFFFFQRVMAYISTGRIAPRPASRYTV